MNSSMKKIIYIYNKNKQIINYLFAGIATTIFSFLSYYLFSRLVFQDYKLANIFSWIFTVLFAYILNKCFVFNTKSYCRKATFIEMMDFFRFRIVTLLIDMTSMMFLIEVLNLNDLISKALVQIIILFLNYVFSKHFVFKK